MPLPLLQVISSCIPILILRNAALLISEKNARKVNKLQLELKDLFLKRNALINKKVRQISNIDLDLSSFKKILETQFDELETLIRQTDASFEGAVKAQKTKQFKGIDHLEERLLKAQKVKLKDQVERLALLHEQLFPGGKLQERIEGFGDFYLEHGNSFIDFLVETFEPRRNSSSYRQTGAGKSCLLRCAKTARRNAPARKPLPARYGTNIQSRLDRPASQTL